MNTREAIERSRGEARLAHWLLREHRDWTWGRASDKRFSLCARSKRGSRVVSPSECGRRGDG